MTHQQLPSRIRLLTFNVQVGIRTQQYRHYLTRSWQHILPHAKRNSNLIDISRLLHEYDIVALQEVDGGSLRSSFTNQTEYLARKAGFPYWYHQTNRNLGKFAQHSNGLLSQYRPQLLEDHKLPGRIPGRGAILASFSFGSDASLAIIAMHLSLSRHSRNLQLEYVADLIKPYRYVVLLGDMNTPSDSLLYDSPLKECGLASSNDLKTFPSWRPKRALDHILVSSNLQVNSLQVLNCTISDHLPVAMELELPDLQEKI